MTESITIPKASKSCWNTKGIYGDRSCSKLTSHIHCRRCSVFSKRARAFLDRPHPPGYLDHWSTVLEKEKEETGTATESAFVFRVQGEWLAVPTTQVDSVTQMERIHHVPYRTNQIFLGMVNVVGDLVLCVSLSNLLSLSQDRSALDKGESAPEGSNRIVLLADKLEVWGFPIDEIHGLVRFTPQQFKKAPLTVVQDSHAFSVGTIDWDDKQVGYLDVPLLFESLRRLVR